MTKKRNKDEEQRKENYKKMWLWIAGFIIFGLSIFFISTYMTETVDEVLLDLAEEEGINNEQFQTCIDTNEYVQRVTEQTQQGQTMGVTGTPTFFVNGEKVTGNRPGQIQSYLWNQGNTSMPETNEVNTVGSRNASNVIIEYSSLTCQFCRDFHVDTFRHIASRESVYFVYRHYTRNSLDVTLANAVECAGEQGEYFDYVSRVFNNQARIVASNGGNA